MTRFVVAVSGFQRRAGDLSAQIRNPRLYRRPWVLRLRWTPYASNKRASTARSVPTAPKATPPAPASRGSTGKIALVFAAVTARAAPATMEQTGTALAFVIAITLGRIVPRSAIATVELAIAAQVV